MSKRTPGPWFVGRADWTDDGNARYELVGIKTVSVYDARLIAASPELLEALVDLVAFYPLDSTDPCVTAARAAIAKAEGKP